MEDCKMLEFYNSIYKDRESYTYVGSSWDLAISNVSPSVLQNVLNVVGLKYAAQFLTYPDCVLSLPPFL